MTQALYAHMNNKIIKKEKKSKCKKWCLNPSHIDNCIKTKWYDIPEIAQVDIKPRPDPMLFIRNYHQNTRLSSVFLFIGIISMNIYINS
jgi:hypothetical protein